jgi:hypothetical protein
VRVLCRGASAAVCTRPKRALSRAHTHATATARQRAAARGSAPVNLLLTVWPPRLPSISAAASSPTPCTRPMDDVCSSSTRSGGAAWSCACVRACVRWRAGAGNGSTASSCASTAPERNGTRVLRHAPTLDGPAYIHARAHTHTLCTACTPCTHTHATQTAVCVVHAVAARAGTCVEHVLVLVQEARRVVRDGACIVLDDKLVLAPRVDAEVVVGRQLVPAGARGCAARPSRAPKVKCPCADGTHQHRRNTQHTLVRAHTHRHRHTHTHTHKHARKRTPQGVHEGVV